MDAASSSRPSANISRHHTPARFGALDRAVYATAGVLPFGVALAACAVPAWRAMRLQPATVLRRE